MTRWMTGILAIGLMTASCTVLPGCSLFAPGADIRQAAEQRKSTTYDSDKNLKIDEATTQNNRTVMVESDAEQGASITYHEDGTPKEIKNASTVLTQCSEPQDVMRGYMKLAEKNAEVAGKITDLLTSMVPVLGARIASGGSAGGGDAQVSRLDQVMEALRQAASRPGP